MRALLVTALATVAILGGATFVSQAQRAGNGIYGVATIGPTCPVQHATGSGITDENCADRPYETSVSVYLVKPNTAIPAIYPTPPGSVPTVRLAATFTTGEDGKFRVNLAPGTYVLRKATIQSPPTLPDVLATVPAGEFSEVTLQFDSGIR